MKMSMSQVEEEIIPVCADSVSARPTVSAAEVRANTPHHKLISIL